MPDLQPTLKAQALVSATIANINEEKLRKQRPQLTLDHSQDFKSYKEVNGGVAAGKPGEDFNRRITLQEIRTKLEQGGWQVLWEGSELTYMTRPGKDVRDGNSATLFHSSRCFFVHTNKATPFKPGESYTPFALWALIDHGGDFSACAKALRKLGYGDSKKKGDGKAPQRHTTESLQIPLPLAVAEAQNKPGSWPTLPILPPLLPEQTQVKRKILEPPPEPEHLVLFCGNTFLTRRKVASLSAAGGTGKTTLLVQAACAWAAGESFAGFKPVQALRVLVLLFEEDDTELYQRLWNTSKEFSENLFAASLKGKVGPLMRLENGTPTRTEWYEWLDRAIANHPDLDLVILDPKSRIYGLDENNNDHNTQWVTCLETLTIKHNVSFLFTHHVSKHTKEINQWMSRGGGALVDACRVNFGMIGLTDVEGKKLGLEDWWDYVKVRISKINIGPKCGTEAYLRFDENGLLVPVDVFRERTAGMKSHFLYLLAKDVREYSRRDLNKEKSGKSIADEMKAKFPDFIRSRDVDLLLDMLLADGSIREGHGQTATRGKTVFRVLAIPENG